MSREIRVTIDDDEVFDRMKHRKQQLDLSWEEVLRRGLRHPREGIDHKNRSHRGDRPRYGPSDDFGEEIARRVQAHVTNTLRDSMRGVLGDAPDMRGPTAPGEFESELGSLERAEDATLGFPFLDSGPENVIPLRVNLRTSADGLDVDVVTIRRGKTVSKMNQFTPDARKQVTEHLAHGDKAVLQLPTDEETYRVSPVLAWSRDSTGTAIVTDVEIETVSFE